jgi:hypothetical protein
VTGPEHYRWAEQMLADCVVGVKGGAAPHEIANIIAGANVHATLALAAATAETPEYYVGGGWARVLEDDR